MKFAFLKELFERLKTSKPAFFVKVQVYAGILFALCGAVIAVDQMDLVTIPEKIVVASELIMAALVGAGVIAQTPTKDPNQK